MSDHQEQTRCESVPKSINILKSSSLVVLIFQIDTKVY